ncbi:1-(5-phosphoribosyl)-5-amino-4-imidazole- carboxylate (AIR) carboxylase [Methanosalsum zhilinae DSM 4017]|uniref:1-(5-phosphoribosyl)-5-amino-4-imidazole-carboxylate (AIR) carboxylase n=1 Tax=Methanosalsum zhilinae (strain DSM 4017 / NBRC 107636 / OCM 62 / WeN5) TaxID=679901 RepID=F7XLS6_METZD|nr:nickel pincer cofactor biosynthesis protein LarB [Methanosalsum zhilinae]AEH60998.1 1-(5-phosphoribosyl)-5-amino-4-imidazole- carboxylate (AIR) carboxylase [Methanosalsum zhilinae DSM 4017]
MELKKILQKLQDGKLDIEGASSQIQSLGFTPVLEIAKADTHRLYRTGYPEAILAEGKTPEDVVEIVRVHLEHTGRVIVTRVSDIHYEKIHESFNSQYIEWSPKSRSTVINDGTPVKKTGGVVGVISAGTADIGVAEEACIVAREMGCDVVSAYDVGVAGIHRLYPEISKFRDREVNAVVVAAGREGTLPAVVSGLIDVPVIGVPVSTGYGAGGKGEAALLSMLQSCSIIGVVNIDAGFVAGALAARIANMVAESKKNS